MQVVLAACRRVSSQQTRLGQFVASQRRAADTEFTAGYPATVSTKTETLPTEHTITEHLAAARALA